jgi:hypothetical protein
LLWLSLGLRQQMLFYGVLACAAGMGVLVKRGYFPGPSTGLAEFVLVLALWLLLWRLEQRFQIRIRLFSASESGALERPTIEALIRQPLEQAMALLWAVGLVKLGLRLLDGDITAKWPATAGLGVIGGLLLIGYFHLFRWVALPFVLGLAGLLAGLDRSGFTLPWLGAVAVLYALLVWRSSVAVLAQPATWRLARVLGFTVPGGAGGSRQVEDSLHACALLVAAMTGRGQSGAGAVGSDRCRACCRRSGARFVAVRAGRLAVPIRAHAYAALIALTVAAWLTRACGGCVDPLVWFGSTAAQRGFKFDHGVGADRAGV